jgi:hypothetical protein
LRKPGAVHRLEQVVHRLGVEGLQRVLVISGDEDQQREVRTIGLTRPVLGQRAGGFQAAQARHADVQEAQRRPQCQRLFHRLLAVAGHGHHLQLGPQPGQVGTQPGGSSSSSAISAVVVSWQQRRRMSAAAAAGGPQPRLARLP